jgi:hypothetical protein
MLAVEVEVLIQLVEELADLVVVVMEDKVMELVVTVLQTPEVEEVV